jgi:dipeptidyl aminopeptidase/acylaminoacyl peptidase
MTRLRITFAALLLAAVPAALAQEHPTPTQGATWQRPDNAVAALVEAPPAPAVSLSPDRRFLLLSARDALPDLATLARPYEKLAGLRLDAATRGPQLGSRGRGFTLRRLATGEETVIAVPEGDLGSAIWAADGERFCFTRTTSDAIELWLCTTATGAVARVPSVVLNAVLATPVRWMPDQRHLLCKLAVPAPLPPKPAAPTGPMVQETSGRRAPARTHQDLLQDARDADLFEHLATSQLTIVEPHTGELRPVGGPDLWDRVEPSPDGTLLLVERIRRPFSFEAPVRSFPRQTLVVDLAGAVVRTLIDRRAAASGDATPTGPRGIDWHPLRPHTLYWAETIRRTRGDSGRGDSGRGEQERTPNHREAVVLLDEPAGKPRRWFTLEHRLAGLQFGDDGRLALASESDRERRRSRLWQVDAEDLDAAPVLLHERSTQDAYGDPGSPVRAPAANGQSLVVVRGGRVFFAGRGASADGERPFLDAWTLPGGARERVFESAPGCLEQFLAFLDADARRLLIRHESPTSPPNAIALDLRTGERTPMTTFEDPAQAFLAGVEKRLLRYRRADGVALSGVLYLPPGLPAGERPPALVWAYPREYGDLEDAEQVRASPFRYERLAGASHLFLLWRGYAVLNDAAMPIVGPTRTANDTFVQQLVQNAEAAVKALVEQGIDADRIAVAGHSYGAFMTANLLAHTDLFAAGIARSGAYNRTLTPFGFQSERRHYWQAPEVYQAMSPFLHAPKINEPLLLIHGTDDNNSGTFPMQSERLFQAIKGHGGTARLVLLPHESHGYRARESVLHCLAEMADWMDRHVRTPKQKAAAAAEGSK